MALLTIIIPVYNEQTTIAAVINQALNQPLSGWKRQLIIVDDGSTDHSYRNISPFKNQITLLQHKHNLGKGAAIRTALPQARGELILIQDADTEYQSSDWHRLISALNHSQIGAVYGSLNLGHNQVKYPLLSFGNQILTWLVNIIYHQRLTDLATGYKLFRTSAIQSLPLAANGFEFDMEVTLQLIKQNWLIKEVPIHYFPRSYQQGKKITLQHGLKYLNVLIRNIFK